MQACTVSLFSSLYFHLTCALLIHNNSSISILFRMFTKSCEITKAGKRTKYLAVRISFVWGKLLVHIFKHTYIQHWIVNNSIYQPYGTLSGAIIGSTFVLFCTLCVRMLKTTKPLHVVYKLILERFIIKMLHPTHFSQWLYKCFRRATEATKIRSLNKHFVCWRKYLFFVNKKYLLRKIAFFNIFKWKFVLIEKIIIFLFLLLKREHQNCPWPSWLLCREGSLKVTIIISGALWEDLRMIPFKFRFR